MRYLKLKIFSITILSISLIQCDGKSSKIGNNGINDANYKELTEVLKNSNKINGQINFVAAAAISTPCVVHIKTKINVAVNYVHPFYGFFGSDIFTQPRIQKQESSGSGVIIEENGYIVTNYHVVQNATEIEVTLRNKNTYPAKIIGIDKDSDLALIKIKEENLPAMQIANSDSVMVGEWVLAVGNPFNLESTVTQGIVSAKGRSLNIGNNQNTTTTPIESFIQTDAAVNPGNSGGALVNLNGELIGINTAIASPTGAYAGYAFAVPSNLVKKVISDLKKYGKVQRAFLGIGAAQLNSEMAKKLNLPSPSGVLIAKIFEQSAANDAGLKLNDVIVKINEFDISTFPEMLEHISTMSPGDKIDIEYIRNGSRYKTNTVLKNQNHNTEISLTNNIIEKLGIKVQDLSEKEKNQLGIAKGIKVQEIKNGILAQNTNIKSGFIILRANNHEINSISDFESVLQESGQTNINLEGIYPNRPYTYQYSFSIN